MEYGLIMAGGSGTRLWPMSRHDQPKQLLPLVKGKSLLQVSYERLRGILPADRIYVCTGAAHAQSVYANLPELPKDNLLGEPVGRDTANAVGFSAAILRKRDRDAVMAVVTADHVIGPIDVFNNSIREAFAVVAAHPKALVTFGIVPTHGHTGLGYIHRGEPLAGSPKSAYRVLAFKEKPDKPTADRYVESGRYYWNSGMFVWRAETVFNELMLHLPEAGRGIARIAENWGTPQQETVLAEVYAKLPKISIDYAILEPVSQHKGQAEVVTVEMPVEWLDVGSWPALAEIMDTDSEDNALDCKASVLIDSDNNIVISNEPDHLLALVGVTDSIIVHTRDATMVCARRDSERVKEMVKRVTDKFGGRYL